MFRLLIVATILIMLPMLGYAGNCGQPCCEQQTCTKPSCDTGCADSCAKPCACTAWEQYSGCEMVTALCISMQASDCDGTVGPLKLLVRDGSYDEVVTIEIAGPIEGYYTMTYTFAEPIRADALVEAVLINDTDDPVTLTWLQVNGIFPCGGYTYFDYSCPGAIVGPGGCPRMVLF